jgi:hypothetical protein
MTSIDEIQKRIADHEFWIAKAVGELHGLSRAQDLVLKRAAAAFIERSPDALCLRALAEEIGALTGSPKGHLLDHEQRLEEAKNELSQQEAHAATTVNQPETTETKAEIT